MKQVLTGLLFCVLTGIVSAQTLNPGEIAFIGYNTDGAPPQRNDDFAFIALTDIPAGEIIYFTDEGWTNQTLSWVNTTASEFHLIWTSPAGGIACGTVIHINEPNADGNLTCTGGGSIAYSSPGDWNLSAGDQVLAYRGGSGARPAAPFFIAGVHGDDGNGAPLTLNATTGWNDLSAAAAGTARSEEPNGLTNAVNCVSLFPAIGTETDNARYNGTLTGTSTTLRALINDKNNWVSDDVTPYNISPGTYSTSVTCVTLGIEEAELHGEMRENAAELHWEIRAAGVLRYELQRSQRGGPFALIAEGDIATGESGAFTDPGAGPGLNLYRLRCLTTDGGMLFSNTVEIENPENFGIQALFPNPVGADQQLTLQYHSPKAGSLQGALYDLTGREVLRISESLNAGLSTLELPVQELRAGMYLLRLNGPAGIEQRRILSGK